MTLLKKFQSRMAEDASGGAVGAGGMAGGMAMPLFSRLVQRSKPKPSEEEFVGDEEQPIATPKKKNRLKEMFDTLVEDSSNPGTPGTPAEDTSAVIAKLKSLENRESQDHRDTVTFGLQDDNDGLVRVVVKHEQAADFEKALQAIMADTDDDERQPEIAEILYKLKDRFDLVDVQWPDVEEDEEQVPAPLDGDPAADGQVDPNAGGDLGADMGDPNAMPGGDTSSTETLLAQVIDMMKADAEARTADARAREAEAKNREASAIASQASTRVKQEEQFLDMDMYNKSKKEADKEAKRLAQLSKWKHEVGGGKDDEDDFSASAVSMSAPEEEETTLRRPVRQQVQRTPKQPAIRGKVHPHDIASFILNRVK